MCAEPRIAEIPALLTYLRQPTRRHPANSLDVLTRPFGTTNAFEGAEVTEMLRIRVEDQPKTTTFYIEGKLAGDSVEELRRIWTAARTDSPEKETLIDLCAVRTVDATGKKLLCQMYHWGAKLAGSGLCMSALIEEITGNQPCPDAESR